MKLRLIENWREAWKFLSIQLAALLALLSFAYDYLPAVQQYLPEGWVKWIALAIIVVRILQQRNVTAPASAALSMLSPLAPLPQGERGMSGGVADCKTGGA